MDAAHLEQLVTAAEAAVQHAQDVRAAHRKKTLRGNRQREDDIQYALQRLKRVMAPIRSELARLAAGNPCQWDAMRLSEASQAIQAERRKLWKMKDRKKEAHRGKRGTRR